MKGLDMSLSEIETNIENIYRTAYFTNRTNKVIRLDPNVGELGLLWAEFDRLIPYETAVD